MDLGMHKLRWLRAPGRHLVQGSLTRLPFADGAFDTVICSEVIEHIPRDQVHLEELVRVVAPGGLLILGTPDYSRKRWLFLEWLYGKVFPNGYVKEHINRYTRAGLQRVNAGSFDPEPPLRRRVRDDLLGSRPRGDLRDRRRQLNRPVPRRGSAPTPSPSSRGARSPDRNPTRHRHRSGRWRTRA
jgi:SAM-dependent methyltransferase